MRKVFFLLAVFFLACESDNDLVTSATLQGKWVEESGKTDTLTFGLFGGQESVQLGRGQEISNGFLQPKSGSGPYEYKLLADTISLRWYLSSSGIFHNYYFIQAGNKLVIGNFYDAAKGQLKVYEKLK